MAETVDTSRMSVKFEVVTLATPFSEVVKYDRDPAKGVRFSALPGEFLELDQGQLNQLSRDAQFAYSIARDEHKARAQEAEDDVAEVIAKIKTGYEGGNAVKRLEVRNERAGFKYRWIRPDMVDEYIEEKGYKLVQNGPERTMANPTGRGPHVISKEGSAELTLVMRSHELEKVDRNAKREAAKKLRAEVDGRHQAAVERDGFAPVTDGTRGDFKPIRETTE